MSDEHYHYTYVLDDPDYIDYKFLDPKYTKPDGYKNIKNSEIKKIKKNK